MWSIGEFYLPNIIALGFMIRTGYDANNVYQATKLTDMRERDVISTLDITSQSFVFDYMNGIRECYIGTDKDPWKYIR